MRCDCTLRFWLSTNLGLLLSLVKHLWRSGMVYRECNVDEDGEYLHHEALERGSWAC